MKRWFAGIVVAVFVLGGSIGLAADLKDRVKVTIESAGLHPGMDPGMYVCAGGHLHVKGTVQNLADVPVGPVKVAGKTFSADGTLLGNATATTKANVIPPGGRTEIDLEFLTVTGPNIQQAKKHELVVVDVAAKR